LPYGASPAINDGDVAPGPVDQPGQSGKGHHERDKGGDIGHSVSAMNLRGMIEMNIDASGRPATGGTVGSGSRSSHVQT
jgi:hypothetical protein